MAIQATSFCSSGKSSFKAFFYLLGLKLQDILVLVKQATTERDPRMFFGSSMVLAFL
jgi:hypothetical protein